MALPVPREQLCIDIQEVHPPTAGNGSGEVSAFFACCNLCLIARELLKSWRTSVIVNVVEISSRSGVSTKHILLCLKNAGMNRGTYMQMNLTT